MLNEISRFFRWKWRHGYLPFQFLLQLALIMVPSRSIAGQGNAEFPTVHGRVESVDGVPIFGAQVQLKQFGRLLSFERLERTASSDSFGGFSFSNMPPDSYVVEVRAEGYRLDAIAPWITRTRITVGAEDVDVIVRLNRFDSELTLVGRLSNDLGEPLSGWLLSLSEKVYDRSSGRPRLETVSTVGSTTDGGFRFDGVDRARFIVSATPPTPTQFPDEFPIYYPNSPNPDFAVPLDTTVGSAFQRLEFQISAERGDLATVSGRVSIPGGEEADTVLLFILTADEGIQTPAIRRTLRTSEQGFRFEIGVVPRRTYDLYAIVWHGDNGTLAGRERVNVFSDVSDVDIVLRGPETVHGRVAWPDNVTLDLSRISVSFRPVHRELGIFVAASGRPDAEGRFSIENVPALEYRLAADVGPANYVSEATLSESDLLRGPFEVTSESDLRIEIGTGGAEVFGRVIDANGEAASNVQVLLVPSEFELLDGDVGRNLRFANQRAERYMFRNVPPGDYWIVAAREESEFVPTATGRFDLQFNDYYNKVALRTLAIRGSRISLKTGDVLERDLRPVPNGSR